MRRRDDYFEGLTSRGSPTAIPVDARAGTPFTGRERRGRSMYENLFLQDVAQSLPFGSGLDEGFHLLLTPEDPAIEDLVLNALPTRSYGRDELAEGFRGFLQTGTFDLVSGRLYLDIEYFHRSAVGDDPPVAFKIHILPSKSIVKRFRKHSQVGAIEGTQRRSSRPLDPKCLVVVELPTGLAKDVRRAIALLGQASSQATVSTNFVTGEHGRNSGFELKIYAELLNDLVLKGTRRIGWAGRNTFLDGMLDPEKAWRAIQFARFQATIRDVLLAGLQEAVDRAGAEIGFTANLKLSGVLTSGDLDKMEADLQQGTRRITQLFHPMLRAPTDPQG